MWRRFRAALSVSLTWAAAGSAIGFVIARLPGVNSDLPLPLAFAPLGFIAGIAFSAILVLSSRRGASRLSLPRFAGWGALGGFAIASVITAGAAYRGGDVVKEFLLFGPALMIGSASLAAGSLALARRADARQRQVPPDSRSRPDVPDRFPRTGAMLLALALCTSSPSHVIAQPGWQPVAGHTQIPLWPGTPPNARPGVGGEAVHVAVDARTGVENLVGGKPYSYIENVTRPTITLYTPTARTTGAAVIVYPGGGFNVLAMDIEGTEVCDWLTTHGVTCVLLKYRVPCAHVGAYRECPQAHQDAQRAMRLVRSRAREWAIDPRRIGVLGFSAGAHMAIMSSTRFSHTYPPVDAADSVSSRPDFALVLYPGRMAYRHSNFRPNPGIRVTDRTPPTFLVHARDDDMNPVENSLLYADALRRARVPAQIHIFATGGHAFGLRQTGLSASGWPDLAAAWLKGIGVINR
ncbi:MAG: alpha/beta hydrolase [Gemmatimonadaceae bacterium]|nr:alpha/beta hydrolase [Gemmatimonadaceae bacterium]